MFKNNTVPLLLGAVVLVTLATADGYRSKRQAPNINVHEIPKTSFSCADKKVGEYYADSESHCQVYHVCIPGMNNKMSLISFVCPNGTIFSQATKVCTPYERVYCSLTSKFVNDDAERNLGSNEYDNYVPPPQPQAPRPPPQAPRSRTTPAPTQSTDAPRSSNRFRSNQFRSNQAPTTAAPARTTAAPARAAPARAAPARPAPPAFRPPAARPTPRTVVSTSTTSYNYEYEYEYDYEDEAPGEQGNSRSKRSAESSFCEDKVPGGAYADVESNCEMFHICVLMGKSKILDYKVHCANGTAFDQETGSCREKDEFVCENAQLFFQFEKQNQPKSSKKPVISKKQYYKSKKIASSSKE